MRFDLEKTLALLDRTPSLLRTLLQDLPEDWVTSDEGEGSWSPFEVLGHLVYGEKVDWIERAEMILDCGETRTFDPFDREGHRAFLPNRTLAQLLDEFEDRRRANLAKLREWDLTPTELSLTGTHPDFGAVTLRQLISTWAVHDLGHVRQIARVLAKRFAQEVGPWAAGLSILRDHPVPAQADGAADGQ